MRRKYEGGTKPRLSFSGGPHAPVNTAERARGRGGEWGEGEGEGEGGGRESLQSNPPKVPFSLHTVKGKFRLVNTRQLSIKGKPRRVITPKNYGDWR